MVVTGSMDPAIEENELIIIKECNNYELNDIVTYMDSDGNLITHRIVQIDEYGFISKGDSNDIADENTDINNIEGKVVYHSKVLGVFILNYLKFVIIIYLVVLLALYLKEMIMKEADYEKEET